MSKRRHFKAYDETESQLFDFHQFEPSPNDQSCGIKAPVWTENKAALISRYLRYFVFITKHGTYLDAFSGPQDRDHPESWAGKLVLESEPKWFRHFAFFEKNAAKVKLLQQMVDSQPPSKPKRAVYIHPGDMNLLLPQHLLEHPIRPKEATFCLLDQHTFECDWATVKALAEHKQQGHKIELFYFLAQGWLDRAAAGCKINKEQAMAKWWGNDSWQTLLDTPGNERGKFLAARFKRELGYTFSCPFPIFEKGSAGKVMFWMVHASDHPEAIKLMVRAYNNVVAPMETIEQLEIEAGDLSGRLSDWT